MSAIEHPRSTVSAGRPAVAPVEPPRVVAPSEASQAGSRASGAGLVRRDCMRPGCAQPAGATLSFAYAGRRAVLTPLSDEVAPQAYDLCPVHAARTTPPRGWELHDERPAENQGPGGAARPRASADMDGTIAVLARALRGAAAVEGSTGVDGGPAPTRPAIAARDRRG